MNIQRISLPTAAVLVFIAVLAIFVSYRTFPASAEAPAGLKTSIATTSNPAVTGTAALIFATSTACDSRIISTYASPIMLTFSDYSGQRPTGTFGHLQAASTTSTYNSGLYGCGAVYAYSFTNQAITISEAR